MNKPRENLQPARQPTAPNPVTLPELDPGLGRRVRDRVRQVLREELQRAAAVARGWTEEQRREWLRQRWWRPYAQATEGLLDAAKEHAIDEVVARAAAVLPLPASLKERVRKIALTRLALTADLDYWPNAEGAVASAIVSVIVGEDESRKRS